MKNSLALFVILVLTVLLLACNGANDVAPGGSSLTLFADPQEIGVNGTSTLTVTGADENGAPLPDGTLVTFKVDLVGSVNPDAVHLMNGRATTHYHATLESGEIMITATSGSAEATTTITVSDSLEENVFVSANPPNLPTGGGTTQISAAVTDGSGNPIEGIGIQFTTTDGTLTSGGDIVQTNSSGVATDTLSTSTSAIVTATTENGTAGQVTVEVGVNPIICHMTVSTTTSRVGQAVSFFDTTEDPNQRIDRFHWDFGDDSSADGKNVQHSYDSAGSFTVAHSVIDKDGNTFFCDPVTIQVSQ